MKISQTIIVLIVKIYLRYYKFINQRKYLEYYLYFYFLNIGLKYWYTYSQSWYWNQYIFANFGKYIDWINNIFSSNSFLLWISLFHFLVWKWVSIINNIFWSKSSLVYFDSRIYISCESFFCRIYLILFLSIFNIILRIEELIEIDSILSPINLSSDILVQFSFTKYEEWINNNFSVNSFILHFDEYS